MEKIDLNKKKIDSGFKTPENYFNDFSSKMMLQIQEEKPVKVISFWSKQKSWIYASAAVLVLAFSIPIFNALNTSNQLNNEDQIVAYLEKETTLTNDLLIEQLTLEEIKNININSNYNQTEIEHILTEEDNLEHYITN